VISRRRRWLRRLLFALLVLLIVIVATIQIVLWTSVPRQIVIAQVQRELGLRTSAASVETGWFGHTVLHDVTLGLPLSDDAFVKVSAIEVRHTNLIPLLLGRSINIRRITLDHPALTVRQDASGAWNVQRAIELVARAGGSKQAEQSGKPAPLALPELQITAAQVTITDNTGRSTIIDPVNVKGWRDGPLVYRYDADAAGQIRLVGQIAPAGRWDHEINFNARQVDALIKPLVPAVPENLNLDGQWTGRVENGAVDGRLDFKRFTAAGLVVRGGAVIAASTDSIRITPDNLIAKTQAPGVGDIRVVSGAVTAQQQTLRANELIVGFHDGQAMISGQWNRTDNTASATVAWRDIAFPPGVSHSGNVEATLRTPFPGKPGIDATLTASGSTSAGSFNAAVSLSGQGDSLSAIDWQAQVQRFAWLSGKRRLELDQLAMDLRTRESTIYLDRLTLAAQPTLRGRGAFDTQTQNWWLWAQADALPLPRELEHTFALNINAWGDSHYQEVRDLYLHSGNVELFGAGSYDSRRPKPVALDLTLSHLPLVEDVEASPLIRGELYGALALSGTVAPLHIELDGDLHGRDLQLLDRDLGDLQIELKGEADRQTARLHSSELELLGGRWGLSGAWQFQAEKPATLEVAVRQLPLPELTRLLKAPQINGLASGVVTIEMPSLKLARASAAGTFNAASLSFGSFSAERGTVSIALADRMLHVTPIQLFHDNGIATATINFSTQRPSLIDLTAHLNDWPVEYGLGFARASGAATLSIDAAAKTVTGPANVAAYLSVSGRPVGDLQANANLRGTYVEIPAFRAQFLSGTAAGRGSADWVDPLRSRAQFNWQDINLAQLTAWVPQLDGLSGISAGEARLGIPDDPHPLGPLQFEWRETVRDGRFRGLSLTGSTLKVFLDRDRIVTEGSTFLVGDGTISLFARATRRRDDNTIASLLSMQYQNLDLNQLVHAVKPDAEPMIGRAAGQFQIAGDPRSVRSMFGDGELHLTQSDLVNFDAVGGIYDLMHLSLGAAPNGTADVRMRLDGENLEITEGRVFNRGVEIIAAGSAGNIWQLPKNKLDISAAGSAQPLKDLKLPFMADVNKIFSVLQHGVTAAHIGGTLEHPQVTPAAFNDLGQSLRKILLGDVRSETRGSAGQ
jgi:hypothetical protein